MIGQTVPPKVDVMWIIDNSCSMSCIVGCHGAVSDKVTENFPLFMDYFLGSGLDYHIGVVTADLDNPADNGRLEYGFGEKYISQTPMTPTAPSSRWPPREPRAVARSPDWAPATRPSRSSTTPSTLASTATMPRYTPWCCPTKMTRPQVRSSAAMSTSTGSKRRSSTKSVPSRQSSATRTPRSVPVAGPADTSIPS